MNCGHGMPCPYIYHCGMTGQESFDGHGEKSEKVEKFEWTIWTGWTNADIHRQT
jgi:hypothetical protein